MNPAQSALNLIAQFPALAAKLGFREYRALVRLAELLRDDARTDWICIQYVATGLCCDRETTRRDLVALNAVGLVYWEDNGKPGRGARRRYRLCLGHIKQLLIDGTKAIMRRARDAVRSGSTPGAEIRKAMRLAALRLRYPFKGGNASAMQANLNKRDSQKPNSVSEPPPTPELAEEAGYLRVLGDETASEDARSAAEAGLYRLLSTPSARGVA